MGNYQISTLIQLIRTYCRLRKKKKKNFDHKAKRHQHLLAKLPNKYKVYYVNLGLGAIGIIGKDSLIMIAMGNFYLSKETLNFMVNRTIKVFTRTTYYIF